MTRDQSTRLPDEIQSLLTDDALSPTGQPLPAARPGLTDLEHPASLIAGGALALFALKRRGLMGLFAAGMGLGLAYRGARQNGLTNGGWLPRLLNTGNRKLVPFDRQLIIDRPPAEVYHFFRNPEHLAIYLPHIRDVAVLDERRSQWKLSLTEKLNLQWTAELIKDQTDQLLAWRVCETSDLYHEGWVRLSPLRDGQSTKLTTRIYILAPGGAAGARATEWLRALPMRFFAEDLQRLRTVLQSEAPLLDPRPSDQQPSETNP